MALAQGWCVYGRGDASTTLRSRRSCKDGAVTGLKRSVEQLLWALTLVVLAAFGIPLFLVALLSAILIVIWVGLPLTVAAVAVIRPYADLHRRFARWYLHTPV